jgi:hypothetical protein
MASLFSNKYPIPDNFPQILHDYAKEIVRNRPKDILDFSVKYFYSLENNLKLNSNDDNHTKDIKENQNQKQDPIITNNDNNKKDNENNKTDNEDHFKILEKINKLEQKSISDKDEDTFSNISGTSNDKIGVKNFVGNIMEESKKCALMKEEDDK